MTFNISNKEILVTGGTGHVGSFIVESLLKENAKVTVIGRDNQNLKEIKLLVETDQVKFLQCDLTNQKSVDAIGTRLKNTQYLVHLSSSISEISQDLIENSILSTKSNLMVIPTLLKYLKNLHGICFSSSVAVFGIPSYLPLDEKSPMNPITFYGCGKLGAEKYLKIFCDDNSIPLTILRYAIVYGPRNRSNQVIPLFIKKALHGEPITLRCHGKGFRDFVYVTDVVDATINSMKRNESEDYNIGSGTKCTLRELAETIIKITNSKSEIIFSDQPNDFDSVTDISKAREKLDFHPRVLLHEGLKREVEWRIRENQI